MKILFYINALNGGGAERVMVNLANQFADEGETVIFVTSYYAEGEYALSNKVKRYALEETEIKQSRLKRNFSRIQKLRKICKKEKPDVAVSFMREPNLRMICATRGLPVKTIVSVRSDPKRGYSGRVGRFIGEVVMPMADGCVFQTEDAKRWFPQRLQDKSEIIFNAVKQDFYCIERQPIPGLVVSCGRLEKEKNYTLLIDSFGRIAEKNPGAALHIYGQGSLQEVLQRQVAELGLRQKVVFKGQTDSVERVLQSAAMFVLPSDSEGMPNALMEALAAGVPCVSTDCPCGGPKMLIESGVNGLLVPVGDAVALADAMDRLLTEPEAAGQMGAMGKESAVRYRADRIFVQWKQYMERVAKS